MTTNIFNNNNTTLQQKTKEKGEGERKGEGEGEGELIRLLERKIAIATEGLLDCR